jgi:hypothetical protein
MKRVASLWLIGALFTGCSSSSDDSAVNATGGSGGEQAAGQGGQPAAGSAGQAGAQGGAAQGGAGSSQAGAAQGGAGQAQGGAGSGQAGAAQGGAGQAQGGAGRGQAGDAQGGAAQGGAGQGGAAGGAAGGAQGGAAGFDPGGEVTTISTSMMLPAVPSGTEDTKCIVRRLGNKEAVYVRRFYTTLAQGSHHMILYTSSEKNEQLDPKPCAGFSGLFQGDHAVFIAQQKQSELLFPKDDQGTPVALKIEANQMMRIELHHFNTTDAPLDIAGEINLDTIPTTSTVTRSDLAFWGTTNINIPAHGAYTTGVKFQAALAGTKTFALTTHQHHFGTRMQVWHGTSAADLSTPVADETNWADPKLDLFSPPLEHTNGAGFAYQCDWKNTSDTQVTFGESINDEMCFLWHYYYPSKGFQICVDGSCF